MKKIIISLCDLTGAMVAPWLRHGYHAILVDTQHPVGVSVSGAVMKIGHPVDHPVTQAIIDLAIQSGGVVFVAAFPPCTDLAVSGARWFKSKAEKDPDFQIKAMDLVYQCASICERSGAPWLLENPVSRISTLWRKPDHAFNPYQFTGHHAGDNYTKKTCLWTGGSFVMPAPLQDPTLGPPDDRIHKAPPGPDRANFRSATPLGFAEAVFLSNSKKHC